MAGIRAIKSLITLRASWREKLANKKKKVFKTQVFTTFGGVLKKIMWRAFDHLERDIKKENKIKLKQIEEKGIILKKSQKCGFWA